MNMKMLKNIPSGERVVDPGFTSGRIPPLTIHSVPLSAPQPSHAHLRKPRLQNIPIETTQKRRTTREERRGTKRRLLKKSFFLTRAIARPQRKSRKGSIQKAISHPLIPPGLKRVVERADVVVLGGGPAGVSAALAARRLGASVLLVERYGFLGGTATSGLYGSLCGFYTSGPEQVQVVRGIAWEMVELLSSRDALMGPVRSGPMVVLLYDPTALRLVLDEMVLREGVELLLHSTAVGVRREGSRITSVRVCTKSGPMELEGKVYVDATGDADVCHLARVPVEKAETLQAGSMMFRVSHVRTEEVVPLLLSGELRERVKEASGQYDLPREDGNLIPLPAEGEFVVGFSRVAVDGTDVRSLTRAELEGRRQVRECFRFLRERIPGFENARLSEIAFHVGVRESRRVRGRYVLTEEEVLSGARFPDAVARCAWPIERHLPHLRTTELRTLEGDSWYEIPYRCCLPQEVDNLLVGGRCLSTTSAAQASTRVIAPSMATGQACGTAAALSSLQGLPAPLLPAEELREELRRGGALL